MSDRFLSSMNRIKPSNNYKIPYNFMVLIIIIGVVLFIFGMFGYRVLFDLSWTDSFYITALTMSGLSLEIKPVRYNQKIFIGIFTLFSVGYYLIIVAAIISAFIQSLSSHHSRG